MYITFGIVLVLVIVAVFIFGRKNSSANFKTQLDAARKNQKGGVVLFVDDEKQTLSETNVTPDQQKYYYFKNGLESNSGDFDQKIPVVETHKLLRGPGQYEIVEYGPNQKFLKSTIGFAE